MDNIDDFLVKRDQREQAYGLYLCECRLKYIGKGRFQKLEWTPLGLTICLDGHETHDEIDAKCEMHDLIIAYVRANGYNETKGYFELADDAIEWNKNKEGNGYEETL